MFDADWLALIGLALTLGWVILTFPAKTVERSHLSCPRCGRKGRRLGSWHQVTRRKIWSAMKCDRCGASWRHFGKIP